LETKPSIYLLIGPGGVGKSSIGAQIKKIGGIQVVDLDEEFILRFGSIASFGESKGWKNFFERESSLFRELFDGCISSGLRSLIVTGAGTLFHPHPRLTRESKKNFDYVRGRCFLICVLPSTDLVRGAAQSVDRQYYQRGYQINEKNKLDMFEKQAAFALEVADYIVLSNNLKDAVDHVAQIVSLNRSSVGETW
jgi:shikimate kinase